MTVPQTDTKTDTKLWFWGSFRNARSSLDYSVEGGILTLQTRQTQPDSVPRLHILLILNNLQSFFTGCICIDYPSLLVNWDRNRHHRPFKLFESIDGNPSKSAKKIYASGSGGKISDWCFLLFLLFQ